MVPAEDNVSDSTDEQLESAATDAKRPKLRHYQVLMYIANLVDYLRYYLSLRAMQYAFVSDKWHYFVAFYYVAIAMDVIDGAFARIFDQVSRFGMCLDMVCDRASVSMIYIVLAQIYPQLEYILVMFFIIDYGAHFLQFTANALTKNTSHKHMNDPNENWLVRLYYTNKVFFITLAFGADNGLVFAVVHGRCPELAEKYMLFKFLVYLTSVIICLK